MNQHFLSTLCFLCYSDLERVNPSRTLPPPPAAAAAPNSQYDFVVDELKKALIWGSAFNVQVASVHFQFLGAIWMIYFAMQNGSAFSEHTEYLQSFAKKRKKAILCKYIALRAFPRLKRNNLFVFTHSVERTDEFSILFSFTSPLFTFMQRTRRGVNEVG